MRYLLALLTLTLFGCGAPRAVPTTFQNETALHLDKQFAARFEKKLANKTTAHRVVYRITRLDEGSWLERASFWANSGAAYAEIWSRGFDVHGAVLWDRTIDAKCTWGFFGGSVMSCIDDIVSDLP